VRDPELRALERQPQSPLHHSLRADAGTRNLTPQSLRAQMLRTQQRARLPQATLALPPCPPPPPPDSDTSIAAAETARPPQVTRQGLKRPLSLRGRIRRHRSSTNQPCTCEQQTASSAITYAVTSSTSKTRADVICSQLAGNTSPKWRRYTAES
jgi:hypothetical protein